MSIPASRRLRHAVAALSAAGLLYLVATLGLQQLVRSAEASGVTYPYKHEDWLRVLLRGPWTADDRPLMLLMGPSTVRENLLVEEFRAAFPDRRVYQGGLSLGTMGDVLVALDYLRRVHGDRALPSVLVLGVSPRFLAEIPDERPLAPSLARYSRHFRVRDESSAVPVLEAQAPIAGLVSAARFLAIKQQPRYQAALAWYAASVARPGAHPQGGEQRVAAYIDRSRRVGGNAFIGALEREARDRASRLISPYRFGGQRAWRLAGLEAWLDDPGSWWRDVYRWDAAEDRMVRVRLRALFAFVARHDIALYVVNLPDREMSRIRYGPGLSQRYASLLDSAFAAVPLLDLRCLLHDDQFLDAEHALPGGARLTTERVVGFMRESGERDGVNGDGRAAMTRSASLRWGSAC